MFLTAPPRPSTLRIGAFLSLFLSPLPSASSASPACGFVAGFLRRGGVLVHVASKAALVDCNVSDSRLAGVDVRTGAEAALEACSIRDGKSSGV